MRLEVTCPGCGKRSGLDSSLVGRRLRCKGCGHAFQVPAADEPADASWLDDGADGEAVAAPAATAPKRSRAAAADGGPSTALMIGLGGGAAALILLAVGLSALTGDRDAPPRPKVEPAAKARDEGPGLFERALNAVTGTDSDPAHDVAGYPDLGPLPPQLKPPAPLRDLSALERRSRSLDAAIDRIAGILATVRDGPSFQAAVDQLQSLGDEMAEDLRRNPLPFQPTPAEDAEVTRRTADATRAAIARVQREADRIGGAPGLEIAGAQLRSLVGRLSTPAEIALKRAENFKPPSGPSPYAEVFIQLQGPEDAVFFHHKLDEILERGGERGILSSAHSGGGVHRASFRVWPVRDVAAFSREIPNGEAAVKGRRIFVKAGPIPAAEVEAAKLARQAEKDAREAEFREARAKAGVKDEADDPKPPDDADDLTRALFALRSSNPGKRKEGVDRIARTAPVEERREEVHRQLAALLGDSNGFLVVDAMKAMVQWRTDETAPALIKLLDRPDFGVRWEAEELLGELGDPRAAEPLAARLKEDGIKAAPALRALGPAAEPALIGLLRHADSHVRAQACDILKDVGGKDALAAMMALPADRDAGVQFSARSAMQALRARVGPVAPSRR